MSCPICKLDTQHVIEQANGDRFLIECARCGHFNISGTAKAMASSRPSSPLLSAWIRTRQDGGSIPMISSTLLTELPKEATPRRISEKPKLFLRALGDRTKYAGQKVDVIPEFDFPLAWCSNAEELEFVIRALVEQNYVNLLKLADPADSFYLELVVTSQGWSQLDSATQPSETHQPMPSSTSTSSPVKLVFSKRLSAEPEHSWDAFISHASEDKAAIARPLAEALSKAGVNIWYDEFTLTVGDSLRRSIDRGLAKSRFGIVILSNAFFQKNWPQMELDGLTAREVAGTKVILPVWHELDAAAVRKWSPILADKMAVSSSAGLDQVVNQLMQVIRPAV